MGQSYGKRIEQIYLDAKKENERKEMEELEKKTKEREDTINTLINNIFDYSPELLDTIDKKIESSAKAGNESVTVFVSNEYNLSGVYGTALKRIYQQRGFKRVKVDRNENYIVVAWH